MRWIAATALWVGVAAAGVGVGWVLRGADATEPVAASVPSTARASAAVLDAAQAKTQGCNAFASNGLVWSTAYKQWLATLSPGWRWDDPAVKDSTSRFDATANQVVAQISGLIDAASPPDVAQAIRAYTAAILAYAAGHGTAPQDQMNAQETAIDAAAAKADAARGLR